MSAGLKPASLYFFLEYWFDSCFYLSDNNDENMDKKILDGLVKNDNIFWPLFFNEFHFEKSNDEVAAKMICFLSSKLSFGYKNYYCNDFSPFAQFDGKRSPLPEDLSEEDVATIKNIINSTTEDVVLAKLNDVLYIRSQDKQYCFAAKESFERLAKKYIEAGKYYKASPYIKRSLFLIYCLEDFKMLSEEIDGLLFDNSFVNDNNFLYIANPIFDFGKACNCWKWNRKKVIGKMETIPIDKSDAGLEFINNIIEYYSSINNQIMVSQWTNKYADLCEALCLKFSPHGHQYLDKALEKLSKNKTDNEERINSLRFKREEEQKKLYEAMDFQQITVDLKENKELNEYFDNLLSTIKNTKDSVLQFGLLLSSFQPVSEEKIKSAKEGFAKSAFHGLFNEIIFSGDKTIRDTIESGDTKKRDEYDTIEVYRLYHSIYQTILLNYLKSIVIDENFTTLIHEIVSNNDFVPPERISIVEKTLMNGLNNRIRSASFVLMSQFEYGCANYLKNSRKVFPVIDKGGNTVAADLNHFLTTPKFRNPISEVLGNDLTNELQYLLVKKQYGNLRNENYHEGFDDEESFNSIELIAFFRILNAYCMGYNKDTF